MRGPFLGTLVFLGLTVLPAVLAQGKECKRADVIYVMDSSGSIGAENWRIQLAFVNQITDAFTVGPDDALFGIVNYGNRATVTVELGDVTTKEEMFRITLGQKWKDQKTNTQDGIAKAYIMANRTRKGVPFIVIVITDGESNVKPEEVLPQAFRLRNDKNAIIFAVAIGASVNQQELLHIVGEDNPERIFQATGFEGLNNITSLVTSGTCSVDVIPTDCRQDSDIVFVLDGSGSVGRGNFESMKQFVAAALEQVTIGPDNSHIGLVVYSDDAVLVNGLDSISTHLNTSVAAVRALAYPYGTTNTAAALRVAREAFQGAGNRDDKPDIIVLFTDGNSNDFAATLKEGVMTKMAGATIIVVAVTGWVNQIEVSELASDQDARNLFNVLDFDSLGTVGDALNDALCDNLDECNPNPCENGGTCLEYINDFYCVCNSGWAGRVCNIACSNPADVALVIDSSTSMGGERLFSSYLGFSKALGRALPVSDARVALGVESYSTTPRMEFYMGRYTTSKQVVDAMSFGWMKGTTNTAGALSMMVDDMYSPNNGRRRGVSSVGIVLTDGRSGDRRQTFMAAKAARDSDMRMITVSAGVTHFFDQRELSGIASYPQASHMFNAPGLNDMGGLVNSVVEAVCNEEDNCARNPCNGNTCRDTYNGYTCECRTGVTGRHCQRGCSGYQDVVFMMDMSGSIRRERFSLFTTFVNTIIDELDLSQTRVGLLTFNDRVDVEFNLNAYSRRQDMQHHINSIIYKAGQTNIADGLRDMRDVMFVSSAGDRQDAPNFGILLTDGAPNVNVERTLPEAIAARVAGIHLVVAAVELPATNLYLQGIASAPAASNIYAVDRYSQLPELAESIVGAICNDVDECRDNPCRNGNRCVDGMSQYLCLCNGQWTGRDCSRSCNAQRDIVFVLDSSGSVEETFLLQMNLAREIIYGLNFGGSRVRVGVMTFSDDPSIRFRLGQYNDLQSVHNAIAFTQTPGKTNTQAALRSVYTNMFGSTASGDRNGVDNTVVLMTDGNSNMQQSNTIPSAQQLKDRNIRLMVVGVGEADALNRNEINDMASAPSRNNVAYVSPGDDYTQVASQILDRICE